MEVKIQWRHKSALNPKWYDLTGIGGCWSIVKKFSSLTSAIEALETEFWDHLEKKKGELFNVGLDAESIIYEMKCHSKTDFRHYQFRLEPIESPWVIGLNDGI